MKQKIPVTQDTLYEYLQAHDVKLVRLADMIGCTDDVVTSCFAHRKDKHGMPRQFTPDNLAKLSLALPRLANDLRNCLLHYGSPLTYTNKHGREYDPGQVQPIKSLGRYMNITGLLQRLLGWSVNKKCSVISRPNAINYGNITKSDVMTINNEILAVAGVLESYQLVIDVDRSE